MKRMGFLLALLLLGAEAWATTTTTSTVTSTTTTTVTTTSTTETSTTSSSTTTSTSSTSSTSTSTSSTTTSSTSTTIGSSVYSGTLLGVVTADADSDINVCPVIGASVLTFDVVVTSGTATVKMMQKVKGGSGFYAVGTPSSLTASGVIKETNPNGCYRVNVDCSGSCNVGPVLWQWR